ncbi:hypothetical protein JCM5350_002782 [Sporobolomyces pararoseus]
MPAPIAPNALIGPPIDVNDPKPPLPLPAAFSVPSHYRRAFAAQLGPKDLVDCQAYNELEEQVNTLQQQVVTLQQQVVQLQAEKIAAPLPALPTPPAPPIVQATPLGSMDYDFANNFFSDGYTEPDQVEKPANFEGSFWTKEEWLVEWRKRPANVKKKNFTGKVPRADLERNLEGRIPTKVEKQAIDVKMKEVENLVKSIIPTSEAARKKLLYLDVVKKGGNRLFERLLSQLDDPDFNISCSEFFQSPGRWKSIEAVRCILERVREGFGVKDRKKKNFKKEEKVSDDDDEDDESGSEEEEGAAKPSKKKSGKPNSNNKEKDDGVPKKKKKVVPVVNIPRVAVQLPKLWEISEENERSPQVVVQAILEHEAFSRCREEMDRLNRSEGFEIKKCADSIDSYDSPMEVKELYGELHCLLDTYQDGEDGEVAGPEQRESTLEEISIENVLNVGWEEFGGNEVLSILLQQLYNLIIHERRLRISEIGEAGGDGEKIDEGSPILERKMLPSLLMAARSMLKKVEDIPAGDGAPGDGTASGSQSGGKKGGSSSSKRKANAALPQAPAQKKAKLKSQFGVLKGLGVEELKKRADLENELESLTIREIQSIIDATELELRSMKNNKGNWDSSKKKGEWSAAAYAAITE